MAPMVTCTRKQKLPITLLLLGIWMTIAIFSPLRSASKDERVVVDAAGRSSLRRLLQSSAPQVDGDLESTTEAADYGDSESDYDYAGPTANCTPPGIHDFPQDFMSKQNRRRGGLVVHGLIAAYLFIFLAVVCDEYFVPSIKILCKNFNLPEDVAGATFMAAATSSPELFINCVGTFIMEGDLGIGTVVGSGVFNILVVPSFCGLFAGKVVKLRAWPLTRDSLVYAGSILLLIGALSDGRIEWFEAATFVCLYVLYVLLLCKGWSCADCASRLCACCARKDDYTAWVEANHCVLDERSPLVLTKNEGVTVRVEITSDSPKSGRRIFPHSDQYGMGCTKYEIYDTDEFDDAGVCTPPAGANFGFFCLWLLQRPIRGVLHMTVPDCRKRKWRSWYLLTFLMSILWIAGAAFIIAWMITVVGDTLQIPDSVMGLTFLAAGTCLPEAVSSVIVTCEGYGEMGISNSIGSNTFNILLCLGLPWTLKSVFFPPLPGQYWININSGGLIYNTVSLLSTLFLLYAVFACNDFKLNRKVGVISMIMYVAFISFAFAVELNTFGVVNLPTCPH